MKHKKLVAVLTASMAAACVFGLVGCAGQSGEKGADGSNGLSAYEIAVNNGFTGTEQEWLAAMQGAQGTPGVQGADGKSAYEVYREHTVNPLSLEQWLSSLKGEIGKSGKDGACAITALNYITKAPTGHEELSDYFDKWGIQHRLQITYMVEGEDAPQMTISDDSLIVVEKNTYYEASTSEEIWKLVGFGVGKISCRANTEFNWVGNTVTSKQSTDTSVMPVIRLQNDLEMNLNGSTLTLDALFLRVESGATVTLRNGSIRRTVRTTDIQQQITDLKGTATYQSMNDAEYGVAPSQHAMQIDASSKLVLDTLDFYSKYDGIKIMGSSATLEVKSNSKVEVEGLHAISTDATRESRYNVIISLSDSDIIVCDKDASDAPISYDGSVEGQAILFNIPGRLNVDNCTVTGRTSAIVCRGGHTVVKNSTLNTSSGYTDGILTEESSSRTGNWNTRLPNATVVVGNHSTNEEIKSYQFVADCTLTNTAVNRHETTRHAVFMYGNEGVNAGYNASGEWIGATLTFDAMTFARSGSADFHITKGNACVQMYRPEMLLNSNSWYTADTQARMEDLLVFGASKIRLTSNLMLDETKTAEAAGYTVFESDMEISLNGNVLNVGSKGIIIRNNANIKFTNGVIALNNGDADAGFDGSYAIEIDEFSGLVLESVKMYANRSGIWMNGRAAALEVTSGSEINVGGFYGIGTNVNGTRGYDTIVTIRNSSVVAKGEVEFPGLGISANEPQDAENKYGVAVQFNVPGVLQVEKSSYLAGFTQGIILRNGTALVEDSRVEVLGSNSNLNGYVGEEHAAWGLGYNVPNAVVVVGTYHTKLTEADEGYLYQERAELVLKNVELIKGGAADYVYIHNDNSSEPSIVTFDKLTVLKTLRGSYAPEETIVTRCENDESNIEIWDERLDAMASLGGNQNENGGENEGGEEKGGEEGNEPATDPVE